MKEMLKKPFKLILQLLLGFKNYLFVFSVFKILTLRWDRQERDFLCFLGMVPPGGIFLDLGANIGIMSVLAARADRSSTVMAFEPVPPNAKALRRVAAFFRLGNITVMECALGNEQGTASMLMPVSGWVRMQGLSHVENDTESGTKGERFSVPIRRLDDLPEIQSAGRKISAIKIDVENFEPFVLRGAVETIKKHRPLIYCELWDNNNRETCFRMIQSLGYTIAVAVKGKSVPFTGQRKNNFIFLPGE